MVPSWAYGDGSGFSPSGAASVPLVRVLGLSDQDQDTLTGLLMLLQSKSPRNLLRRRYYDHRATLRDLGISIPPQLRGIETVMSWPEKAVDVLARRVVLEEFTLPNGGSSADLGLDEICDVNRLWLLARQAQTSALLHSTAFVTVTAGDTGAGEPPVVVMARSALYATGVWDPRPPAGLRAALSVISVDPRNGMPDHMVMYVPNRAVIMRRTGVDAWDIRQSNHDLGVPVEPLVFRPELDRPFGRSRITRAVMSITDRAVRTAVRTEVGAEFFSTPQRYILGADDEAFIDKDGNTVPAWSALIGRILMLGRDENGDLPTVNQFSQQSMEPHLAQMRQLAAEFAAATDLMPDTMGVIQDNPSSAEAIGERKEELALTAEDCGSTFGSTWVRSLTTALRMVDDSPAARAQYARLRARYRNPKTPSLGSAADATMKLVQTQVYPPDSEVTYDGLNLSEAQREILRADVRRMRSRDALAALKQVAAAVRVPVDATAAATGP